MARCSGCGVLVPGGKSICRACYENALREAEYFEAEMQRWEEEKAYERAMEAEMERTLMGPAAAKEEEELGDAQDESNGH